MQVEFVSANPTGPLHVGHGRGAAFGASLANVLDAAGFVVTREFYVNDAGRQMDILALSTWLRYLELNGLDVPFPANAYQGRLRAGDGAGHRAGAWPPLCARAAGPARWRCRRCRRGRRGSSRWVDRQRQAGAGRRTTRTSTTSCSPSSSATAATICSEFGVSFDHWFSEKSLYDSGQVERALEKLRAGRLSVRAGRREVVSQLGVRGREGPRGAAGERAVHLLRVRHRLPSEQVRARLRSGDQRVGRRSSRLHFAREGRAAGARDRSRPAHSSRWCNSRCSTATARRLRCPRARATSSRCASCATRSATMPRASSTCCARAISIWTSISIWPSRRATTIPVYYVQYAHARICSVLEQWGEDESALRSGPICEPLDVRAGVAALALADGLSGGDRGCGARLRAASGGVLSQRSGCHLPQLLQFRPISWWMTSACSWRACRWFWRCDRCSRAASGSSVSAHRPRCDPPRANRG